MDKTLKDLKPGDKVARYGRGKFMYITTVKNITPKGAIRTNDNHLYAPSGDLKTSDAWAWGRIEPLTQKHLDEREKEQLREAIVYETVWHKLSLDQLRAIHAIINEEGK